MIVANNSSQEVASSSTNRYVAWQKGDKSQMPTIFLLNLCQIPLVSIRDPKKRCDIALTVLSIFSAHSEIDILSRHENEFISSLYEVFDSGLNSRLHSSTRVNEANGHTFENPLTRNFCLKLIR